MVGIIGLLLVLGWYAMYAILEVPTITFERTILGMMLGIALIVSERKEK